MERRQVEEDIELDQKRQKIEPTEEETNISDVILDCQEKIFSYLDLESLYNVGISSPCLREAAKTMIYRKYEGIDTKKILLFPDSSRSKIFLDSFNVIIISGFKKCLQVLRCFGDKISIVEVFYLFLDSDRTYRSVHYSVLWRSFD